MFIEVLRTLYITSIAQLSTKPLVPPTREEQLEWWRGLDHSKVRVWLWFTGYRGREVAAFSMLTDRGSHATPMFAISPEYHGRGFARKIIKHYIAEAGKPLRGEQLVSNDRIRRLNAEAGWRVTSATDTVEYLEHDGPKTYPDYDALLKGLDG